MTFLKKCLAAACLSLCGPLTSVYALNEAVMTGTNSQTIQGQKVFQSVGDQGTPLIGWSQSGASALVILQDSFFENPACVIQRSGTDGDTTSTPTLMVLAGKETAFDQWVFETHGCTVTGGDNSFLVANSGGFASSDGAYDLSNSQLYLGRKAMDFNKRQAIGADGVTAKIVWSGDSVRMPGQTLTNSDSVMTWALADGRYVTLTALGNYTNGGTINNTGTFKNSGIFDNSGGYTIAVKTSGTVLMRADADAAYDKINTINTAVSSALAGKAASSITISAGAGLTGGGDLTTGRTISIDFARANTWTGTQTFNANTVQNGAHNTAPGHSGVTPNSNDLLIKSQADALYASATSGGVIRVYYAQWSEGIQLSTTLGKVQFYQPHGGNIPYTCNASYVTQTPAGAITSGSASTSIKLTPGVYTFNASLWNDAANSSDMTGRKGAVWLKVNNAYWKLQDVEQYNGPQGSAYLTKYSFTTYVLPSTISGDIRETDPIYLYCEQTAGATYAGGWKASLEIFRVGNLAQ